MRAVDGLRSAGSGSADGVVELVCGSSVYRRGAFHSGVFGKEGGPTDEVSLALAPGYESVFVSYSTRDAMIIDWLESTYTALGMGHLRDVKTLRTGETWDERLLELIGGADLFQLCWSQNAKASEYVSDEWRFALGLNKPALHPTLLLGRPYAGASGRTEAPEFREAEPPLVDARVDARAATLRLTVKSRLS